MRPLLYLAPVIVLAVALTLGARTAYASDAVTRIVAPIVLAANDKSDKGGVLGIFNSSKKKQGATKPYDYGAQAARKDQRRAPDPDMWGKFKAQHDAMVIAKMESSRIAVGQNAAKREASVRAAMAKRRQAYAANPKGEAAAPGSEKKMVYDPKKAWTYDPNKPKDKTAPPRIYNTR